jgi:hypothetical protein
MPFTAVPAAIKVDWFYTYNGQNCMNRIYVNRVESEPSAATCAVVAQQAADWWNGNCKVLVPPTCELRLVQATSAAVQNGPSATFSTGLPSPGTNGQPALPGNVTICVSLRTGLTGRSARGRWYWVGLGEGQVVENTLNAGVAVSITAAMDNLINAMNAINSPPLIVSFFSNGGPRPGGPVKFFVTDALLVDTTIDSQRGRLR